MTPLVIRNNKFGECQYNGTPCYYVEHIPSGGRTLFEHDKNILNDLIDKLQSDSTSLRWFKGRMMFNDDTPLRRYLYNEYNQLPLGYGSELRIMQEKKPNDKRVENCRACNLYATCDLLPHHRNRHIKHSGNCIIIEVVSNDGKCVRDYAEYSPELFEILARPDLCTFWITKSGRIAVTMSTRFTENGTTKQGLLGSVVSAFYHLRPEEPEDFPKMYVKYTAELGEKELQVDHLNSDKHNHFVWSLSVVPASKNKHKWTALEKIKPPYFLHTVAMHDGTYRFCFGYNHDIREYGTGRVLYFRCNDIDDLTRFVNEVLALKEPTGFFRKKWVREHLPVERYNANREAKPDSHRIGKASQMATRMLSMDKFEFTLWAADSTIETALAD